MAESEDERESGESENENDPEEEEVADLPTIPFGAETQDLIIDFRAACSIPFDPESDAVKSLRAIIFGKGNGMHSPNEAGKVYVVGEWKLLTSLMKVYFIKSTHRQPELLLAFVDYGFAHSAMSGVSVETLALPLLVRKGVYQDATRLTRLEDVAGFSPIPITSVPWSISLKPTLAKQDFFKKYAIYTPADINKKWLSSQRMGQRVDTLEKRARAAMEITIKDMARQDPSQANRIKAMYEAKLKTIVDSIAKLPPSAYDVRMAARVCQLMEDRDVEKDPIWLTSPLQKSMREGSSQFARTRLVTAAPAPPIRVPVDPVPVNITGEAAEPEVAPQPVGTGMDDLELSNDDSDAGSELDAVEPRDKSKRARSVPRRLDPAGSENAPKVTKKKVEPTPAGRKRGPYKKAAATAASTLAKAERAALKKELKSADTKAEVASLKLLLKAAVEGKRVAEDQLKDQGRMVQLEIDKARAEGEKLGLQAAGEEYKKGIAAGAAIASGKSFHFAPSPPSPRRGVPSSAAASSSYSSSNPFGSL